ncbi:hypothetical protein SFRURICE_010425, partial [Spodoptera frugiperda]
MFWRRISMHGQFPLHKQEISCKNQPALDSGHRACHVIGPPCQYDAWEPSGLRTTVRQWSDTLILRHWISRAVQLHGMHQNLTPVDFYMKRNRPCIEILLRNIFENYDEIRRIFRQIVTVIEIRKRVRACIRHRG